MGWLQGQSGQEQKTSPPPELDPRTVQPVASSYTDYAILDHLYTVSMTYYILMF